MNPARVLELQRDLAKVVTLINSIPAGRTYDMAGHIDAKREAAKAAARLSCRIGEFDCGERAKVMIRADRLGQATFPTATSRRRA